MKNKKGNVVMVALIIAIVAMTAGVLGWMFAKKSQAPFQKEVATTQQVTPTPVTQTQSIGRPVSPATQPIGQSAPISTKNNYANAKGRYSFTCPTNWKCLDDNSINSIFSPSGSSENISGGVEVQDYASLDDYMNTETVASNTSSPISVVIDGVAGIERHFSGGPGAMMSLESDSVSLFKDGKVYNIYINWDNTQNSNEITDAKLAFKKVIDSFKFTK